jgi:hypothetical protein
MHSKNAVEAVVNAVAETGEGKGKKERKFR